MSDLQPGTAPADLPVILFTINGHRFGFRRPTRADDRDMIRRAVAKASLWGRDPEGREVLVESPSIDRRDGYNLDWEARLEIGLLPRRTARGGLLDLGECAPEHWREDVLDEAGKNVVGHVISFDRVPADEYREVVAYLEEALKKKPPSAPEPSMESATATSGA